MAMQPGTGFVNIDQYLNANKGAGGDVSAAAGNALSSDDARLSGDYADKKSAVEKAFGNAPGALTQSTIDSAFPPPSTSKFSSGVSSGVGHLGGTTQQTPDASAILSPYLSWNNVAAPSAPNFNSKDDQTLTGLGNSNTTGRTLASLQNPNAMGQYTPKLDAIDRAIYGQGAASGAVNATARQQALQQGKYIGLTHDLSDKVTRGNERENHLVDLNKTLLGNTATGIYDTAQGKATAENKQQSSDQATGTVRDPNTGQVINNDGSFTVGQWQPGSGNATAGNYLSTGQASELSQINKLLGGGSPTAQAAGTYSPGYYQTQQAAGSLAVTPDPQAVAEQKAEIARQKQRAADAGRNTGLGVVGNILTGGISGAITGATAAAMPQQAAPTASGRASPRRPLGLNR